MNKEFIHYDQALELKELGFNDECLLQYSLTYDEDDKSIGVELFNASDCIVTCSRNYPIKAPLYQQAFRWFREYYNLDSFVQHHIDGLNETYFSMTRETTWDVTSHNTYEEAELACLKKLIEVIKNK